MLGRWERGRWMQTAAVDLLCYCGEKEDLWKRKTGRKREMHDLQAVVEGLASLLCVGCTGYSRKRWTRENKVYGRGREEGGWRLGVLNLRAEKRDGLTNNCRSVCRPAHGWRDLWKERGTGGQGDVGTVLLWNLLCRQAHWTCRLREERRRREKRGADGLWATDEIGRGPTMVVVSYG